VVCSLILVKLIRPRISGITPNGQPVPQVDFADDSDRCGTRLHRFVIPRLGDLVMRNVEIILKEVCHITCDCCGMNVGFGGGICRGCEKDICRNCKTPWYDDPFIGNCCGDHPMYVCSECDTRHKDFASQARLIRENADAEIEKIIANWKSVCRQG